MSAPVGHEVTLWCEDPSHDKAVRIDGFLRVADGTERENGYVHRYPRVWVHDATLAQMGRSGPVVPVSGLHRWYDQPAPGRVLQRSDDDRLYSRCPRCKHSRTLRWDKLLPLLEKLAEHGVARLSLQDLASTLRK